MAKDIHGDKVFKENVWWQNGILYLVAVFFLLFNIGGGVFHMPFFGEYAATAAKTAFGWKLLGIFFDLVGAGALIYAASPMSGKGNGAIPIVTFVAVVLSTLAMVGFFI